MNNTIPRWNLDSIFPSIESSEYKNALSEFSSSMDTLSALLETASDFTLKNNENFDFPAWLASYLEAEKKTIELSTTLNAFAYIIYSTDTTNVSYLNNISKIDEMSLRCSELSIKFRTMLVSHSKYLDDFYARFPQFSEYKFLLEEEIEESRHQMTAAEENLARDLQRTGGDAWDRLHEQIISTLKDEKTGKTFNELRNDAYDADEKVRKYAWENEIRLLKQNEVAFAACLNNLKGETVALNKRRHWNEAIDRSLSSSRMKKETLDSLIGAIEESLPLWRKYLKKKAELLGGEKGKGVSFYDLFAPLPLPSEKENSGESLLSKKWTFEEAKNYVLERYYSFSKEMGDFAKNAFENSWIDAEVHEGKVGGAYDEDFPLGHQSRILTNFTGSFSDIITLAHELGHAYHFSCLKGKSPAFFSYPMTLAETASTFAETIVKQDAISKSEGSEKLLMLEMELQDACQVLVDILCRFYFERSVFEERKNGELTAEDFCRLMKDAQEKSYGDGLNESRHEYMWAVKSHYYSTGLDFYNFPYAFGQLFASALFMQYKKSGAEFAETYAELLRNTGSMSCEDLCKKCGFDITKKDFWMEGIEFFKKEIDEFCR